MGKRSQIRGRNLSLYAAWSLVVIALSSCSGNPSLVGESRNTLDGTRLLTAQPANVLRYAVFPAPPYMIGAGETDTEMTGIDIEIAGEISDRLGMQVEYVKCTWERCLDLMKDGEVDLLSSAYKKPEREAFMVYFDRPYLDQLPIAFYTLKENHSKIAKYEDIYQFERIGVLQGAGYFERFDHDPLAKKVTVPSQDQLFPMLLAGRVDVLAGYVPTENFHIHEEGYGEMVERSEFVSEEKIAVYMTVSKKSPLAARIEEINKINQALLEEGFIAGKIQAYYDRYQ